MKRNNSRTFSLIVSMIGFAFFMSMCSYWIFTGSGRVYTVEEKENVSPIEAKKIIESDKTLKSFDPDYDYYYTTTYQYTIERSFFPFTNLKKDVLKNKSLSRDSR